MPLAANAGFRYTPPGGLLTTVPLNVPLLALEPAQVHTAWVRESLDLTVREVFEIGGGVQEITAEIRFIDDPQPMLDMLRDGRNGVSLTYHPDLGGPGLDCLLIANGDVGLGPDPLRGGHMEYATTVRLRRTAGDWSSILS